MVSSLSPSNSVRCVSLTCVPNCNSPPPSASSRLSIGQIWVPRKTVPRGARGGGPGLGTPGGAPPSCATPAAGSQFSGHSVRETPSFALRFGEAFLPRLHPGHPGRHCEVCLVGRWTLCNPANALDLCFEVQFGKLLGSSSSLAGPTADSAHPERVSVWSKRPAASLAGGRVCAQPRGGTGRRSRPSGWPTLPQPLSSPPPAGSGQCSPGHSQGALCRSLGPLLSAQVSSPRRAPPRVPPRPPRPQLCPGGLPVHTAPPRRLWSGSALKGTALACLPTPGNLPFKAGRPAS